MHLSTNAMNNIPKFSQFPFLKWMNVTPTQWQTTHGAAAGATNQQQHPKPRVQ